MTSAARNTIHAYEAGRTRIPIYIALACQSLAANSTNSRLAKLEELDRSLR